MTTRPRLPAAIGEGGERVGQEREGEREGERDSRGLAHAHWPSRHPEGGLRSGGTEARHGGAEKSHDFLREARQGESSGKIFRRFSRFSSVGSPRKSRSGRTPFAEQITTPRRGTTGRSALRGMTGGAPGTGALKPFQLLTWAENRQLEESRFSPALDCLSTVLAARRSRRGSRPVGGGSHGRPGVLSLYDGEVSQDTRPDGRGPAAGG